MSLVVHAETPTRGAPGIGVVYRHQTVTPASGEHGGLLSDTLGVVAVHGMKWRCLADATFDQVGPLGMVLRKEAGLDGDSQARRRIGKLSQERLAADDDLVVLRDIGRDPNEVLEVGAIHARARARSPTSRQIRQRWRGERTPANGVDCRSSVATSPSSVMNSNDFRHRSLQDLGPAADVVRLRTTRHPSAHSLPGSLEDRRIRQK